MEHFVPRADTYYVRFSIEHLHVSALCLVLWRRRDRVGDSVRGEWRWLNHGGDDDGGGDKGTGNQGRLTALMLVYNLVPSAS